MTPNHETVEAEIAERRRRLILLLLHDHLRGAGNEDLLQSLLDKFGFRATRDAIRADLNFLEQRNVIRIRMAETVMVAELLKDGEEYAENRRDIDGITNRGCGTIGG